MEEEPLVAVVDDDVEIRCLISRRLAEYGFTVRDFPDAASFMAEAGRASFSLLILDVMLPGEDGLSLCRRLRQTDSPFAELPILFLSALGEDIDRTIGLEVGGDDYLAKPFLTRELVARVKALLRRTRFSGALRAGRSVSFAGWKLDRLSRQLSDPEGVVVPLSAGEFRLLSIFLENPGRILSRERIMELSIQQGDPVFDRTVDTQVRRLRARLRDDARNPSIIVTARGDGYMFAPGVTR